MRLRALSLLALGGALFASVGAQSVSAQAADTPMINASTNPLLRGLKWRSIGPIGQGGRVDDIAVVENDPTTYYVGFATGGIWKTTNAGTTFAPIFDTYRTHSIGDIAHRALRPQHHVRRHRRAEQPAVLVVRRRRVQDHRRRQDLHPDRVSGKPSRSPGSWSTRPTPTSCGWRRSAGCSGPIAERGVFKSTDGGRTWRQGAVRSIRGHGATDLVMHPTNPNVLFASTYARRRTAWGFASGGAGSGIWRSDDGGETWTRLTGNGLPNGTMGRVGARRSRARTRTWSTPRSRSRRTRSPSRRSRPAGGGGGGGGFGGGQQNQPPDPQISGIWRSTDGGRNWEFRSNQNARPMYFSQIRVDPNNDEHASTRPASTSYKSTDGGTTFETMQRPGPRRPPRHLDRSRTTAAT